MTILPTDVDEQILELAVSALTEQFRTVSAYLIQYLTVEEVLMLVGESFRTVPTGTLLAHRLRQAAEEIEETGYYLTDKYDV